MDTEVWMDIKNYEGLYQVSNFGNIKSLNYNKTNAEKILKQTPTKSGYLHICLHKNCTQKYYYIHRLVATTFLDNLQKYKEVNHKDENKQNNNVTNLEWCNASYNANYGTRNTKLSKRVYQYTIQGKLIKVWSSIRETGGNCGDISSCCNHKRKTSSGYIWKFESEVEQ